MTMTRIKRFCLLTTILLICTAFSAFAQETVPKLTWNIFSAEDLKMTSWVSDTSASAAILGNVGDLNMEEVKQYYGFRFTEMKRIKIFKKSGFDYANIRIPYYAKDETQQITNIRAQTITPDGYKHPVEAKNIVHEKINDKWSVAKFTFPKVTEGCILEYEYDLLSTQILELREWYFQDRIPTRFSVLNLDLWSRYEFTYLFQGEDNLKSTKPKYDTREGRTTISFHTKDLPGLKDESYVTSVDNYLTRIRFQLSKYFSLPSGAKIEVMSTWEKTADELLNHDNLGKKFLKKSRYSKVFEASQDVYSPTDSTKLKVQKIYDWINHNIAWDGHYYLWSDKDPNDVLKTGKGGSSDINFILLALLKEAGVIAQPVLVSTRKHGVPYLNFPIIDQFDHCLVLVEFENKQTMILDAGHPYLTMGLPSEQALNGKGWLMRKKDPVWIEIKPAISSQVVAAKFDISKDGGMKGTLNNIYRGHIAAQQRMVYEGDETGKSKVKYLKTKNPDWLIESLSSLNLDKPNDPFRETINCTMTGSEQSNADLIYFKPTLKSGWEVNPFKLETRTYPVEFPYPTNDQYILTLNIPEGYKVEELPKSINLVLPPEDARFTYSISNEDKTIKMAIKIQINKTAFAASEYVSLKNFFNQIAAKLEEMIVLKKIAK